MTPSIGRPKCEPKREASDPGTACEKMPNHLDHNDPNSGAVRLGEKPFAADELAVDSVIRTEERQRPSHYKNCSNNLIKR